MVFVPVSDEDGSWGRLKAQWRTECEEFGEGFESYAPGVFSILDPLARDGHPRCGIYALTEAQNPEFLAFCQANRALIPGYPTPVLRVRMMTFSPRFDFGDVGVNDYAK